MMPHSKGPGKNKETIFVTVFSLYSPLDFRAYHLVGGIVITSLRGPLYKPVT